MTAAEPARRILVTYNPGSERITVSHPQDMAREDACALRKAADIIDGWADRDGVPK